MDELLSDPKGRVLVQLDIVWLPCQGVGDGNAIEGIVGLKKIAARTLRCFEFTGRMISIDDITCQEEPKNGLF